MPDILDPPKKSFSQMAIESRPGSEAELRAMQAAPPEPPKPKAADAPPVRAASKPVAVTTADPDAEILEGKRAPKGDDFKRVKHAATEANKRADELKVKYEAAEKRLAELDKHPKHNADLISKLEKERDDFKTRYESVTLEITPEFHTAFKSRMEAVIGKVKDLVPADRVDKLAQLMTMPDSEWKRRALGELTEDLDPIALNRVLRADEMAGDILAEKQGRIAKANETLGMIATERQKQQEERKTAYAKSFDDVIAAKSVGDDAIPVLQIREGDTPEAKAWNEGVVERKKVARAAFMDEFDTPEEKAESSIWAASAPGFLAELKAAQAENAALKETLAKLQGSAPSLDARGKGGEAPRKMTMTERMMENAI